MMRIFVILGLNNWYLIFILLRWNLWIWRRPLQFSKLLTYVEIINWVLKKLILLLIWNLRLFIDLVGWILSFDTLRFGFFLSCDEVFWGQVMGVLISRGLRFWSISGVLPWVNNCLDFAIWLILLLILKVSYGQYGFKLIVG